MLLKYFYDRTLAQASYMIGCQETHEALIVDPSRDIDQYLHAAQQARMTIIDVAETHIHADFVSGARELAHATGAALYLSAEGGEDWSYQFLRENDVPLKDGDSWMIGNIRIEAMHTPGHTPEHMIFLVTDTAGADKPMGIITGDCLFVNDVGRPDLLETAAGVIGSKEVGARGQFANVQKLKTMPDYLQVWPGHGAGSACGKSLGAIPSSTLGYEKLFNPAFQFSDEDAFVRWLLTGQPDTPHYFKHMKRINKEGPALLTDLPDPLPMDSFTYPDITASGANVIDARPDLRDGTIVTGAIRIPPTDRFNTYAGWMVNYDKPTYLIASAEDLPRFIKELHAVGIDQLEGFFTPDQVESYLTTIPQLDVKEAADLIASGAVVLDVRAKNEFHEGHIHNAVNLHYGMLAHGVPPLFQETLPQNTSVIVYCATGARSQIASSMLQNWGVPNVYNLTYGFDSWQKAGLTVEH